MCRHFEMRKARLPTWLGHRLGRHDFRQLSRDTIRAQLAEEFELALARRLRTVVGEIDDFALSKPVDRCVRLVNKARHALRKPMIPPGLLEVPVHSLLNDSPTTIVCDDKAVQIQLEPVLDRGAVDFGD